MLLQENIHHLQQISPYYLEICGYQLKPQHVLPFSLGDQSNQYQNHRRAKSIACSAILLMISTYKLDQLQTYFITLQPIDCFSDDYLI